MNYLSVCPPLCSSVKWGQHYLPSLLQKVGMDTKSDTVSEAFQFHPVLQHSVFIWHLVHEKSLCSTEFHMLCFAYIFLTSKVLVNINLEKFLIRKHYDLLCPMSIIIHNLGGKSESMSSSQMLKSWEE